MNRQEKVSRLLMLEQAAAALRARAGEIRDELTQDACAELDEQGTAPTWRVQDIGTVILPVSQETVHVRDEAALLEWVRQFHPTEVETVERVRPAWLAAVLPECRGEGDSVVWMREGALIPGLVVRPGGIPQALNFRPTRDARLVAREVAERLVDRLTDALDHQARMQGAETVDTRGLL